MVKLKILPKRLDYLDVNDDKCQFRINIDVLNEAFGVGRSLYMKAGFPDKDDDCYPGNGTGDKFRIWMPKFYKNSSQWINTLSADGTKITEIAEDSKTEDWIDIQGYNPDILHLVFVQHKNKTPYKFVGVFKVDEMIHLKHTYSRIATKVKLIGNPVKSIELLDDIR